MMKWAAALVLVLVAAAGARAGELPTRIELYTMGSGDDLFEAFGHSALCVIDDDFPRGACYNYGTADFSEPEKIFLDVLRMRAVFFVARMPLPLMLQAYVEDDRTIYRQKLELPPGAAEALAARLENDLLPENRSYVYNHYRDNCATRLRDHLDAVSGGALGQGTNRPYGPTYRELTQRGFAASLWLLAGMEVLVGRAVDTRPTVWQAMFLPEVLRAECATRFHAPPEVFNVRKGPVPELSPLAGRRVVWMLALGLTLVVAAAALLRRPALWRMALVTMALILGLLGTLAVALAAVALMPELRRNEVLLVFLPTDLALAFLRDRKLAVYLLARCGLLAVIALALAAGVLVQPMWAAWALAAGPIAVATVRAAR